MSSTVTTTTSTSRTSYSSAPNPYVEAVLGRRKRYRWDEVVLFVMLFILLVCGSVVMGLWSYLTYSQNRQLVPVPWYFYFLIITGLLTVLFVFCIATLYAIHLLLPIIVLIQAFVLFVLWLTGLIKQSIELWGPLGSINDRCMRYVYTDDPLRWGPKPGPGYLTWAKLQQEGICNMWKASFAFELIAAFLMMYLIFMSFQVLRGGR